MDTTINEAYYFRFDRSTRTFLGLVRAANIDFMTFNQTREIIVTVSMSYDIIEEIIFQSYWVDYREDDADYLYLGEMVKESNSNYSLFTPELKYHIKDTTIVYIEEADRVTSRQVR